MTYIDAAAAGRVGLRLALLAGILAVGLAGCESGGGSILGSAGSLFGSSTPPPPVQTAQTAPKPATRVAVAPVIGAPDALGKQMNSKLAEALGKQSVVVTAANEPADFTLRGYVVAAKEKAATKVSYIWDVTDPAGKRVNRITGEEMAPVGSGKDPWSAVTPALVDTIVGKSATSFAAWLPSQTAGGAAIAATGAPTQTASLGKPPKPVQSAAAPVSTASLGGAATAVAAQVQVVAVTGAPGDGGATLTAAIQRELAQNGIPLATQTNAYKVEGKVVMGQPKDGKQTIQIEWKVRKPDGSAAGTVSQKNEVPQGSLDGSWGKTADQAAHAAAEGIIKLLPQGQQANRTAAN